MVELFPYNNQWPDLFEEEKERLIARFGKKIIAIEHIGSASIPGMLAKPIIDMNVAVASLDDTGMFIQELPRMGYEYMLNRRFHDRYFSQKVHASSGRTILIL